MDFFKNENNLLKIIKFGPLLFVLTLSFLFTQLFIIQQTEHFEGDIQRVKGEYIEQNKQRVKEEVNRIYNTFKLSLEHIEEDLKKEVTNRANEAFLLATKIYKQSKEKNLTDKETLNTLKHTLGNIIFDKGQGYYFIIDSKGILLLQPLNREFENTNILTMGKEDIKEFGNNIIQSIHNKKDSYQTYIWNKKGAPNIESKKISLSKYFEPFNFMIGTGKHIDEYEKTIQQRLLHQINSLKFNNDGFIFIYHLDGTNLSHQNEEYINQNHFNSSNPILKNNANKIMQIAKQKQQGFTQFQDTKESNNREKISYIRLFKEWNWIIGSSFYLDKVEKEIIQKQNSLENEKRNIIKKILLSSILITFLFIIISFFITKVLAVMLLNYKKSLQKEINNTIEKEKMLIQQSRLATMGEMIGNIAHQWKQPLGVITMAIGSIQVNKALDTLTDKEIDTSTQHIKDATDYLAETIDDFRNFFNPNKERKYFSTTKLIDKMLRLIHSQYKNYDIEIIQNVENIELFSYENELLQVLINLLNNARDELIQKDNSHKKLIFIDIYSTKKNVIISIKDNALGIPHNIIHKIFDSHFTTKVNNEGTGIGLYMSKQIIEHSILGTLTVENVNYDYENLNYDGALFTIKLPQIKIS